MNGVRKFLAVIVSLVLGGVLLLGLLRLLNLSGVDIAWFRAIPWLFFWGVVVVLGAGLYFLLRKPRQKPQNPGTTSRY